PSASKLHDRAKFRFHSLPKCEGIRNIVIHGKDFYLPCVTLSTSSDITLRNLIAYEILMTNSIKLPLTEYIGLIAQLIVNVDDVELLQNENIIKGDLSEAEVVKLFTGMHTFITSMNLKEKKELQENIKEVKKVYESRLIMQPYLLLKKLAYWLLVALRAIGSWVEASWKIVVFMVSVVTLFILTWQAFTDVYDWYEAKDTLSSYASV
nr:putative UPF0481 protein At3g02645 [Tanacetum cinerariifolium]